MGEEKKEAAPQVMEGVESQPSEEAKPTDEPAKPDVTPPEAAAPNDTPCEAGKAAVATPEEGEKGG